LFEAGLLGHVKAQAEWDPLTERWGVEVCTGQLVKRLKGSLLTVGWPQESYPLMFIIAQLSCRKGLIAGHVLVDNLLVVSTGWRYQRTDWITTAL
jgi:hypothetical protein